MQRANSIRRSGSHSHVMAIAPVMGQRRSVRPQAARNTFWTRLASLAVRLRGRPQPEAHDRRRVAADNVAQQITRSGWILF